MGVDVTRPVPLVLWFAEIRRSEVALVGGKNASLGEMIGALSEAGIRVPEGFAVTAAAYWLFIDANDLRDRIAGALAGLAPDLSNLAEIGAAVRAMIRAGAFPEALRRTILEAYARLAGPNGTPAAVAVRSSATAEDLPEASFAGQQESFLNIRGEEALLGACRRCFASLFTDRAIAYREAHGFDHMRVALSVGVQRMVRADLAGAGVMFSLDPETGFPRVVHVVANWGLGESVVQGGVDPDEYHVFKPLLGRAGVVPIVHKARGGKAEKVVLGETADAPTRTVPTTEAERLAWVLSDAEVLELARWAVAIEAHYGRPMDMEWAKDGETGELYIVQARPETVQSRRGAGRIRRWRIVSHGRRLAEGLAIGDEVAIGPVCRLAGPGEAARFPDGAILVAATTDPNWVPVMRRASAIVTDHGGRTSHAAIVSRELGVPAVVGAGNATEVLRDGMEVTVSCAEGDRGYVYEGRAEVEVEELDPAEVPATRTKVMVNMANPAAAYRWWRLPADGIGLARMEFIIGNLIRIHPMALVAFERVSDPTARAEIERLTRGYDDRREYFVECLALGIARLAAAWHPKPVIVRMSDFKTNEYARLIGGDAFEPPEENPMLGWRGASRYYAEGYRPGFALECRAIRRVREVIGLDNVIVMIPFCRTPDEADRVLAVMAEEGLRRGEGGLEVYVMAEIPANVLLVEAFAERFDGFSIGSNDLTQLVLGVDRDNAALGHLFDERNPAVRRVIAELVAKARAAGVHTGLCGQAPSDHPDFARFLVEIGIESMSVSPDSFIAVKREVATAEAGEAGAVNPP